MWEKRREPSYGIESSINKSEEVGILARFFFISQVDRTLDLWVGSLDLSVLTYRSIAQSRLGIVSVWPKSGLNHAVEV